MRHFKSLICFILAGVLHALLVGGFVYTMYPQTYTATAKFLIASSEQDNFYIDLLNTNKQEVLRDSITRFHLEDHPAINRALPRDNTKWSKATLFLRQKFSLSVSDNNTQRHIVQHLDKMITLKKENDVVEISARTPLSYLSQNIVNTLVSAYKNRLENKYDFVTYDPYTNAMSGAIKNDKYQITVFPAGSISSPDKKPKSFIFILSCFASVLYSFIFWTFYGQKASI